MIIPGGRIFLDSNTTNTAIKPDSEDNTIDFRAASSYTDDMLETCMLMLASVSDKVTQLHEKFVDLDSRIPKDTLLPFGVAPEGATDNMGSKFQQKIEVGIDQDGHPVYRWATGNTVKEYTDSVCRLVTNYQNQ